MRSMPRGTLRLLVVTSLLHLGLAQAMQDLGRDQAVLELDAPAGATVKLDGRPTPVSTPTRFEGLEEGRNRRVQVAVEFPDGSRLDRTVLLRGGWRVRMPLRRIRTTVVETVPQFGHNHLVNAVASGPDGKYIVSGGMDALAILWDATTGQKLRSFHGHSFQVHSVAFSPDGNRILTGSADRTAILWDIRSGNRLRTFSGHTEDVTSIAFAAGGKQILTGSKDKTAILWDASTGEKIRSFQGQAAVTCLACGSDDKLLAMGSADKRVLVWDLSSGERCRSIDAHLFGINFVAFSPDGTRILTGGDDELVCLWDASTGRKLRNFRGHDDAVTSVAFSADGTHALSGSRDKTAIVWDIATGQKTRVLKGNPGALSSVAIGGDGRNALVASGKSATLWSIARGVKVRSFGGQADGVNAVAFGPDGRQFRIGTIEGAGIQWDEGTGLKLWSLKTDEMVWSQAFSPDGKRILTSFLKGEPTLWEAPSGNKLLSLTGARLTNALAFRADGKQTLTGAENGAILWDVKTGQKVRSFLDDDQMVVDSVAFSPDGKQVLVGAELGGTILWDATTGKKVRVFDSSGLALSGDIALFTPSGKHVLTNAPDDAAILWDPATGEKVVTFHGESPLQAAAFSPDGSLLATGSRENDATVWDAATGQAIHSLKGHTDSVNALAFSPDGRRLLTGSRDGTARMWDIATGDELAQVLCIDGGAGWLALTPQGLFDGSGIGRERVCFRLGGDLTVVPVDDFFQDFYFPGLLTAISRLERPVPKADFAQQTAPSVRIVSPPADARTDESTVDVVVEAVDEGGGVQGPYLYRNGTRLFAAKETQRVGKVTRSTFRLELVEGDNRLEARAAPGSGGRERTLTRLVITYDRPLVKPDLWVLAVGVNEYADDRIRLRFAGADARGFGEVFDRRGKRMYAAVHVTTLLDGKATRAGIFEALGAIATTARSRDTFILTMSGHGTTLGQRYYFLPHEFRSDMYPTLAENVRKQGIPIDELGELLGKVPAVRKVLILDTCGSGGATGLLQKGRGPFDFQGAVERMNRTQGMFTIAACAAGEEAQEPGELGHGLLSYTLLAGLGSVDRGPLETRGIRTSRDDQVTDVLEWFSFAAGEAPALFSRYFGRAQDVHMATTGNTFPLLPLRDR